MTERQTKSGWRKRQVAHIIHPEPITEHYSEEYDAYYNPVTNEWIESTCDDPTCEYCVNRPDKPNE